MAWIAEDERNMIGLIEVAELPERPVVAHHLAVVGGQGDDGAVPGSGCLQALDEPTDLAVDLRDHAPIGGAHRDRKTVVSGKRLPVRVDLGRCRIITKKNKCYYKK